MPTLAAQMYTLRDYTKTPADIKSTLRRVKKIGYNAVQLSALGKIDPHELAAILKGEGLTCCATHTSLDRMQNQTQAVIDEHLLWDCQLTAIGGFSPPSDKTPVTQQTWLDFAHQYNDLAKKFAASGLRLGYHNHSHELAHFNGQTALQILLENFDPSIWMEIDVYWITHGGGDPVQWINRCATRLPAIHFKDMAITLARKQFMAEVGEGNLNWPGILIAAKQAGTQWFIVEQDECYRDPFLSLQTSFEHLRDWGVKA
ncbi:MAG: sugar phosphate isomerase/epimerase [Phycisphaerales bacterium]|nr:sugar phosphate isomerase/epimerase [Phycisphaerales bacterium]